MKRFLFTTLFVGLVLALAVAAVFALKGPDTAAQTAAAEAPTVASPASALAPASEDKYNAITMVLDATDDIPDAETLSQQVVGVQEVLRWNPDQQYFESWIPDAVFPPPGGHGVNFNTQVGEPYLLKVNSSAPTVFSLVGDVPPQTGESGAVQFALKGDATSCKWNYISLPLDQSSITDAEGLSLAIGDGDDVEEVLMWDANQQLFVSWIPDVQFPPPGGHGVNFSTQIGYPYFVCMNTDVVWP